MRWDSHNRLAQMSGAGVSEGYVYDENGQRLRKSNLLPPNNHTTYYFPGYEETSGGVATRHYAFNGVAVAVRTGSGAPSFLYEDGVNSTVYTTDQTGTVTSARGYYAFGGLRTGSGTLPTDRRFTGQQEDATGIYYMNARYYDPQLGMFLSPDTIVPDPSSVLSYNRYLYANGNPLKYNDPSGHCSTLENGEPDVENDSHCWGLAQVVVSFARQLPDSFDAHWHMTPDEWLANIASLLSADNNYLQFLADRYYKEWGRQVGLPVDRVEWPEPVNKMPVKLLGQDAAEAVVEDVVACQENWPWGCSNLADDTSTAVSGSAVLVCAATTSGGCLVVGGFLSTIISGGGSVITTRNALTGDATTTDAIVSWSTTILGAKFGTAGQGLGGVAVGVVQRIYDWWTGSQQ